MSEDFLSNDLKSVNISQPTSVIDPKFTFLDKFLEKRLQRKIVKGLIDQRLIPPDAVKTNTFTLKFNKLSNTQLIIFQEAIHNELYKSGVSQSIQSTSLIPTDFMDLLESDVFGINIKVYFHIFNQQCFKNAFGETLVDFFDLTNPIAVKETQMAVNQYYDHTRTNPFHQSKNFEKGLIEHFGSFTDSNNEPYITA